MPRLSLNGQIPFASAFARTGSEAHDEVPSPLVTPTELGAFCKLDGSFCYSDRIQITILFRNVHNIQHGAATRRNTSIGTGFFYEASRSHFNQ
jgi:hypothetical protein